MHKSKPKWLFLDLDNTLWDFDLNAEDALSELFHRHHLHLKSDFDVHAFVALYKSVNEAFWQRYERGEITKDFLRTERFTQTFLEMGIPKEAHPENIWEEYLNICPQMKRVIPGALEFLKYMAETVPIAVITNGFAHTQKQKLAGSGIGEYIRFCVNSEDSGVAKPDSRIFKLALDQAGAAETESVYVGDNWRTDVLGAVGAGIPVVWFNQHGLPEPEHALDASAYLGQATTLAQVADLVQKSISTE